ncbi:MAG: NADH:flavin oxidoreductase [Chloroflexota bacterium]
MPGLFDSITIKNLRLKNRVVFPPMGTQWSTEQGEVTDRQVEHYAKRAAGGTGLIIVEHSYVAPEGRFRKEMLGAARDELIPGLRRLADAVHAAGAAICLQLNHAGALGNPEIIGKQPAGPSDAPHPRVQYLARPLSKEEIARLVQDYADAAARAQRAGFDAVEVHGCHGYLLCQFASPITNKRQDEYGGDLFGRYRFPLEVVRATRERLGAEFPIFYRLPASDLTPGGLVYEDALRIAPRLLEAGADVLDISGGIVGDGRGHLDNKVGWWVEPAQMVREATGAPVVGVGRIVDARYADSLVREGRLDLVAVGRAQFQNAEWANEAARALGVM